MDLSKRKRTKKIKCVCRESGRKEGFIMEKKINATEKFCTRCGRKFIPVGREVICPECKQAAAEDAKRAAVLKAKRASWTGESVPVRISGRASAVIRRYGAAHNVPFAQALDALLQSTAFFENLGVAWSTITPYKSHRRDKHATESTPQDVQGAPQTAGKPQGKPQEVKTAQAAKVASKATSKTTGKAAKTSKAAAGKGGKA